MYTSVRLLLICSIIICFSACTKERGINTPGNLVPKTVDLDPELPSVNVNGARLHAEAFGKSTDPLVIVLHGGPGADYRYLLRCRELADAGYRIVFYDQRGAGLSQRFPHSVYTMQLAYDDLAAIIRHYKTSADQKVFLLGHSWGAMLATAYINEYPQSVSGAVLGEPGGFIWQDVEDYLSRSRKLSFFSEDLNDAVYMEQFITGKQDQHAILDYKFGLWSAAESGTGIGNEAPLPFWRGGAVTFDAYLSYGEKERPDWTTHLQNYKKPVLFIYSENNKAYGIAHAQKVSSAYPNATLFKTMGAGHDMLSFTTGWNNTRPTILNYLNSLK